MLLLLSSAAMLAAVQADATPVQSPGVQDVVVTGQRLKRIRVYTKRDRKTGLRRCIVRRTSGDRGLDSAFCDSVLACAKTARKMADMEACLAPRLAEIARQPGRRTDVPQ